MRTAYYGEGKHRHHAPLLEDRSKTHPPLDNRRLLVIIAFGLIIILNEIGYQISQVV